MLDAVYTLFTAGVDALVRPGRTRQVAIAACFAVPFGLIVWMPPWYLEAYWAVGAPMLLFGSAMLMLDFGEFQDRREAARKAGAPLAQPPQGEQG